MIKRAIVVAGGLLSPLMVSADALNSDEVLGKITDMNDKYACTPQELDSYIQNVTRPMFVPLPITSSEEHIQNQLAKKKMQGNEESCMNLVMDDAIFEELKKLIEKIENLEISLPPNILDALLASLYKRMKELYDGMCNAMTRDFAKRKIEDYANSKNDFDVRELQQLRTKENRQRLAAREGEDALVGKMDDHDIDRRWANLDGDGWNNMAAERAERKVEGIADDIFYDD